MASAPLHVLVVADSPAEAAGLRRSLGGDGRDRGFLLTRVDAVEEAMTALKRKPFEVVLLDQGAPDATGLEGLRRVRRAAPQVPVVVTGLESESEAERAVRHGAQDCWLKGGGCTSLGTVILHAIERHRLRAELARRVEDLARSEARYRQFVDMAHEGIWVIDGAGCTTFVNVRMTRILGYDEGEMLGHPVIDFLDHRGVEDMRRAIEAPPGCGAEGDQVEFVHRDGHPVFCLVKTGPAAGAGAAVDGTVLAVCDITERVLQQRLARCQGRIQAAVWRMAGPDDTDLIRDALRESLLELQIPFDAFSLAALGEEQIQIQDSGDGRTDWPGDAAGLDNIRRFVDGGRVVYRPDLEADDPYGEREYMDLWYDYPVRAVLDVPFSHGTLAVNSRQANAFGDQDVAALSALAQTLTAGFRRLMDLRQLRQQEEQLRQAQKLEAIGQLAGGVAHDFNNLLTVIGGYCQSLQRRLAGDEAVQSALRQIGRASERGAGLVRQLLAFSRHHASEPRSLNLSQVVADVETMLRRLIREDVRLEIETETVPAVRLDPGQIEQVIVNLVVNARDAMPTGGGLRIRTWTGRLAEVPEVSRQIRMLAADPDDPGPARYVALEVTDTGVGMDAATRARIFDPFFTTKEMGTGLGLATVYGVVRQAGGCILVESAPGRGTVFRIYLPVAEAQADDTGEAGAEGAAVADARGETILLVEDEKMVRELERDTLAEVGYRTLQAEDGVQALDVLAAHPEVALVVSDVVMPRMGGKELLERLRRDRPGLPVLLTSGYIDRDTIDEILEAGEVPILHKPFDPSQLTLRVGRLVGAQVGRPQ